MRAYMKVAIAGFTLALPYCISASVAQDAASALIEQHQSPLSDADQAAIRSVVSSFADSWSKHDMAAMHALDAPNVEWINVVGNDWVGLDNVRKGHTNYHHFLAARSTASLENIAVRAIAPGVALAVISFHFGGTDPGGKPEDTRTRASAIMVKQDGSWKFAHFHNTIINPTTQGPADPMNFDERTGLPKGAK